MMQPPPPGMQSPPPGGMRGFQVKEVGKEGYWKNGLFSCCGDREEDEDPEIFWTAACAPPLLMGRFNQYTAECDGGYVCGCCGCICVGHEMVKQQRTGMGPDIRMGMSGKNWRPGQGMPVMPPGVPRGPPPMQGQMPYNMAPPMHPGGLQAATMQPMNANGMQHPMQQTMQPMMMAPMAGPGLSAPPPLPPGPPPQAGQQVTVSTYVVHQQISAPAGAFNQDGLPSGWVSGKDSNTGRTYYYNAALNRTQWEKPSAVD